MVVLFALKLIQCHNTGFIWAEGSGSGLLLLVGNVSNVTAFQLLHTLHAILFRKNINTSRFLVFFFGSVLGL